MYFDAKNYSKLRNLGFQGYLTVKFRFSGLPSYLRRTGLRRIRYISMIDLTKSRGVVYLHYSLLLDYQRATTWSSYGIESFALIPPDIPSFPPYIREGETEAICFQPHSWHDAEGLNSAEGMKGKIAFWSCNETRPPSSFQFTTIWTSI